jgi:hypothetical protein
MQNDRITMRRLQRPVLGKIALPYAAHQGRHVRKLGQTAIALLGRRKFCRACQGVTH